MIYHIVSSASSFTGHPRHPIYLLVSSLEVMLRVPTALHLLVAYDDDIIRHLINYVKTTNLLHIHIVFVEICS